MVSKLVANTALLALIAQAIDVQEVSPGEMSDAVGWEFAQLG